MWVRVNPNPLHKHVPDCVIRAMQNPAAYVAQKFPDIPQEIRNNPGRIMSYLQQSRNISEQDMNSMAGQARQYYNGV